MTTTAHLGDCLNGCQICADNHHEGMKTNCPDCGFQPSISWGELAELTHQTQVERFGFCSCEDNEGNENPFSDCPKIGTYHGITQATCLNCGRVTLEVETLEIMNDQDPTCGNCGFHLVAWFTVSGVVVTWEDKQGESQRQELEMGKW